MESSTLEKGFFSVLLRDILLHIMHRERQLRQLSVTHSTTYTAGVAP